MDKFIARYETFSIGLAFDLAKSNIIHGMSINELKLVALETAFFALNSYPVCSNDSFYPYWKTSAKREILKIMNEHKKYYSNNISYETAKDLFDIVGPKTIQLPITRTRYFDEQYYVNYEFLLFIVSNMNSEKEMGAEVVYLQFLGVDVETIAKVLNMSISNTKRVAHNFRARLKTNFFGK